MLLHVLYIDHVCVHFQLKGQKTKKKKKKSQVYIWLLKFCKILHGNTDCVGQVHVCNHVHNYNGVGVGVGDIQQLLHRSLFTRVLDQWGETEGVRPVG